MKANAASCRSFSSLPLDGPPELEERDRVSWGEEVRRLASVPLAKTGAAEHLARLVDREGRDLLLAWIVRPPESSARSTQSTSCSLSAQFALRATTWTGTSLPGGQLRRTNGASHVGAFAEPASPSERCRNRRARQRQEGQM